MFISTIRLHGILRISHKSHDGLLSHRSEMQALSANKKRRLDFFKLLLNNFYNSFRPVKLH